MSALQGEGRGPAADRSGVAAARSGAAAARSGAAAHDTATVPAGLALVRARPVVVGPVEVSFALRPGDRALVTHGQAVVRGAPLAERLRDPRTEVLSDRIESGTAIPGGDWVAPVARRRRGEAPPDRGELLFASGGRWRLGTGEHREAIEAPFAGIVRAVRPGTAIRLGAPASAVLGREVLAGPSSGRLEVLAPRDGDVRASEIDVGGAGAILVAGAHIDAEAITRARAVGVRGIVVASLGVKERRDVLASERRGQAAVHGLPPFAILVLDGSVRRPIASPMMAVLERAAGSPVAIVGDPPCLVLDHPADDLPAPEPDLVRVLAGPLAGAEGRWAGLAGPHRFPGGVVLEAGYVRFAGRPAVAVPLGDLERFT